MDIQQQKRVMPASSRRHSPNDLDFDYLCKKKKITLSNRGLVDKDLDVLTRVLRRSDVLEELRLTNNRLTLACGKLAGALAHNGSLRVLNLGYNRIAAEGAKKLAAALKVNNTIQKLYMFCNHIGDEGAKSLAGALGVNKSLHEINLWENEIGDEGAQSIASSFEMNKNLRELHLSQNIITDKGAQKLVDALEKGCTIDKLLVNFNPISRRLTKKIKATLNHTKGRKECPMKKERKDTLIQMKEIIVSKDAQVGSLKHSLSSKDRELLSKEAEIARKNEELANLKNTIRSLKNSTKVRFEQQNMLIGGVDSTARETNPLNGCPLKKNVVRSNLFISCEQNKKVPRFKQEKHAAEITLKKARQEKENVDAHLEDVRVDLISANDLVRPQVLATDIWQQRFNELASLLNGHVGGPSTTMEKTLPKIQSSSN